MERSFYALRKAMRFFAKRKTQGKGNKNLDDVLKKIN